MKHLAMFCIDQRFFKDLKRGIMLETTEFVRKLKDTFLPDSSQIEFPQYQKMQKDVEPSDIIHKAAAMLGVNMSLCRQSKRIPKEIKVNRDLVVFCIWKTGLMTNEKIGDLFGVSYSSISHIVKSVQVRLNTDKTFMTKFMKIYSIQDLTRWPARQNPTVTAPSVRKSGRGDRLK